MNELHLFAGAGGGILGGMLLGHTTVCAVEIEPYCQQVLLQRQRDGILPRFPIWDDVRTFDGTPWRGHVDILCGGFPCQDISAAGKGIGITGSRSGLWKEYARLIGEVRPKFIFAENSPNLRTKGLGTVIQGLTCLGYDVRWCVLGAWHVGANHKRNRMWILAYSNLPGDSSSKRRTNSLRKEEVYEGQEGQPQPQPYRHCNEDVPDPNKKGLEGDQCSRRSHSKGRQIANGPTTQRRGLSWWEQDPAEGPVESRVDRVAHGVACRVDRIKAIGNGQVPAVAATAFALLSQGLL